MILVQALRGKAPLLAVGEENNMLPCSNSQDLEIKGQN
jgi:hypothetical protein